MASKKITLDKYYSPQSIADYCTQKAIELIMKGRSDIDKSIVSKLLQSKLS